jgi:glycine/D-amino acid oxidase-like deaminating enzyme
LQAAHDRTGRAYRQERRAGACGTAHDSSYGGESVKDYRRYSFWLDTCEDDLTPRPPLDGSTSVDVAILGAGFSGLWAAYYLLQADPSLKVAVVEAEIAGFGASGRNGGWCVGEFPYSLSKMVAKHGEDTARSVLRQMYRSVDEVGQVCEVESIDAHYVKPGSLHLARSEYHMRGIEEAYEEHRALGLGDHYAVLDAEETASYLRVARTVGAILMKEGASVQPARLARGLARAVERRGATIYEQTRVTDYETGPRPRLITERGDVSARVIVLAGEAYLSGLPKLRRQIIPSTSHMVVTEPLDDDVWANIGWEHRGVVTASGSAGGYLNKTKDGRIAFGPFGSVYPFGSRVTDDLDRQEHIFERGRQSAYDWFPILRLRGVRFTHSWGGVFGMPRDRMPVMSYDQASGVATARGYSGEGVATSNLSGRVLADLITGKQSELTELPMTRHRSPSWELEPLRWLGVTLVRRSVLSRDRRAEKTGRVSRRPTLAQWFWDR